MEEVQKYELAEVDYVKGAKYKDIADKYGVSINTVKSWKVRYEWTRKGVHTKEEKVRKKEIKGAEITEEVKQVMGNETLNDKQRMFCLYFVRSFNATKSYQKAYGANYSTAASISYRLLEKDSIKEEIYRLKKQKLNKTFLEPEDIFQKYMDIAFADITDFTTFGTKEVTVTDDNGRSKKMNVSFVDIEDSNKVDGTMISEVSKGKDGVKVKLGDRMKALEWLTAHLNIATEEQKARISVLQSQAKDTSTVAGETGVIMMPDILEEGDN